MKLLDLGDYARGRVVDVNDWGGRWPAYAKPAKVVGGEVIGVHFNAPEIVTVQTPAGETYDIRRGKR